MGTAESASASIRGSVDTLVFDALERQYGRWPELKEHFSEHQKRQMSIDTRYHLDYISSSLWFEEPAILSDYAVWCKVLFINLDLPAEWLIGAFQCIVETLNGALADAEADVARNYIEGALDTLRTASTETTSFIVPGSPLGELAQRYMLLALAGERFAAVQLLDDAVDTGTAIRDIYLQVFQPVQREIGRLWLLNQLSVAQEHYVTAVTQMAMARLCQCTPPATSSERTLVAACVGGELHELGARMVADFFEMEGWSTRYLGANTPNTAILEAVRDSRPDVLALSATMAFHVNEVAETIALVRADETIADTQILVGGYPFDVAPNLWRHVGADAYAPDAATAPDVAARLFVV